MLCCLCSGGGDDAVRHEIKNSLHNRNIPPCMTRPTVSYKNDKKYPSPDLCLRRHKTSGQPTCDGSYPTFAINSDLSVRHHANHSSVAHSLATLLLQTEWHKPCNRSQLCCEQSKLSSTGIFATHSKCMTCTHKLAFLNQATWFSTK